MSPDDPGFRREAATHFRKVAAVAKDFTDDFAAIEPPEDDRERIAEFNAANEEAIGRLDALVAALESDGDPSDELQSYTEALAKADRLGEAYGFEVCAQIPEG